MAHQGIRLTLFRYRIPEACPLTTANDFTTDNLLSCVRGSVRWIV